MHTQCTWVVLSGNPLTGSGIRSVRKMTPVHPLIVGQLSCWLALFLFAQSIAASASPSMQYSAFIQCFHSVLSFRLLFHSALFILQTLTMTDRYMVWCHLIPQAVTTFNMLRYFCLNPKLSSYNQIFCNFYFDQTPLFPLVPKLSRTRWKHSTKTLGLIMGSKDGIHIGPSIHHYWNYEIYFLSTKGTRNCPTVVFLPQKFPLPSTSSQYRLAAALEDLKLKLANQTPATSFLNWGHPKNDALQQLLSIFPCTKHDPNQSPRVPPDSSQWCPLFHFQGYPRLYRHSRSTVKLLPKPPPTGPTLLLPHRYPHPKAIQSPPLQLSYLPISSKEETVFHFLQYRQQWRNNTLWSHQIQTQCTAIFDPTGNIPQSLFLL